MDGDVMIENRKGQTMGSDPFSYLTPLVISGLPEK
jgi:hypothetical protein